MPKASGGGQRPKNGSDAKVKSTPGKAATGVPPKQRSRLAKLATQPEVGVRRCCVGGRLSTLPDDPGGPA